jgi:membrane protein DedA with SNARE-associated domain
MYSFLVAAHSYNRYLLLGALLFVLYRAYTGWLGKKPFEKADNSASAALLGLTHLQLVLGLVLYAGVSTWTKTAFADMGGAMKNSWLRYFAVEHIAIMLIAVVMIQLGRTLSKKATSDEQKHRKLAIYTTLGVLLILASLAPKGLLIGTVASAMAAGN